MKLYSAATVSALITMLVLFAMAGWLWHIISN